MKKIFTLVLAGAILLSPVATWAAQVIDNAGIIERTVWLSKDEVIEGETVDVYTVLYNGGSVALSGQAVFYDGTTVIGKRTVALSPKSTKVVSISWKATSGVHTLKAGFISGTITNAKGMTESVSVSNQDSASVSISIKSKNAPQVGDQIADLRKDVKEKTPAFIENAVSKIDSLRTEWEAKAIVEKEKAKAELPDKKAPSVNLSVNVTTGEGNPVSSPKLSTDTNVMKSPMAYMKFFGFSLLVAILSHKIIFYGAILLIVFIILKSIFKSKK